MARKTEPATIVRQLKLFEDEWVKDGERRRIAKTAFEAANEWLRSSGKTVIQVTPLMGNTKTGFYTLQVAVEYEEAAQ